MPWEERHREEHLLTEIRDMISDILALASQLVALLTPSGATTAVLSTKGTMTTTGSTPLFNLSATVANTSGAPLLDNDGVTPFVQPASIPVAAGATDAVLTFTDATGASIAPPTGDGSGLLVTFASDNPEVTIGTAVASAQTATAPITVSAPPPADQAVTAVLSTS